ncbi:unnamed protein product [Medioppia subpectinata]|uniref:G domain-containing protein n=1 Tax=Medioppia subpectinata TaxID=1979941 RepID=A0A7R9KDE5_9ACAR|nr:unnamed protein product [Medioppia subpectinata]CAG2101450.1 unnamed protein product [Medioppia subpectinata]
MVVVLKLDHANLQKERTISKPVAQPRRVKPRQPKEHVYEELRPNLPPKPMIEKSTVMIEQDEFDGATQISRKKEITILLLGETGVGKSTFINALVNYLSFESLDAANGQPICLIPTRIPVRVVLGEQDMNENTDDPTKSATQYPKCYKFQDDNIVLNIIDTPGIGDTEGMDQDNKNMQNILNFISNYKEINAFCVLLKPNEARLDILFNTDYLPGDSGPALLNMLKQIRERPPNVDIPYNKNTIYCFDSESFRYLVASVPPNNIEFDPRFKSTYIESWDRSVDECRRLLDHIIQLPAHKVMDTLSLNNAKQIIQIITKPLADITKNIAENVKQCERHKRRAREQHKSGTGHKPEHIPNVELIYTSLRHPKTVCNNIQCSTITVIDDMPRANYNTGKPCHSPCYLDFNDCNIMGSKSLLGCRAFNKYGNKDHYRDKFKKSNKDPVTRVISKAIGKVTKSDFCRKCGHSYREHLTLTYETSDKLGTVPAETSNARPLPSLPVSGTDGLEAVVRCLDKRIAELNAENKTIINSMAMFACFLANNTLTACPDAFDDYIQHLMAIESRGTDRHSRATVAWFEQLLHNYRHTKLAIMNNQPEGAMITVVNT